MPDTGTPPVRNNEMPATIELTPKVIINGETPKTATPTPLTKPTTSAAPRPARQPSTITNQIASGKSVSRATIASAEMTDVSATTAPTDRSKPPVTSASICPVD